MGSLNFSRITKGTKQALRPVSVEVFMAQFLKHFENSAEEFHPHKTHESLIISLFINIVSHQHIQCA